MSLTVDPPLEEAVARVLAVLVRESRANVASFDGSAWREAALLEAVERADDESGYTLSPRSTRGATRA